MSCDLPKSQAATRRLGVSAAAAYVGASKSFMDKARLNGNGPVFLKLGKKVLYDLGDLDAWLACRRRRSTSDLGAAA